MTAITISGYQLLSGTAPGNEPVLPSFKAPAGAVRVFFYLVTPTGVRQDPNTRFRVATQYTFDAPSAGMSRRWLEGTGAGGAGDPELISGGIVDGDPGDINANTSTHWDFDPRGSMAGVMSGTLQDTTQSPPVERPLADAWVRPTFRILEGNPGGVWVAVVAVALDVDGNPLEWDLGSRV